MSNERNRAPDQEDPDAPAESVDATSQDDELEKLRAERDRLLAQVQRAQADYQNLRRRQAADVDGAVRRTLMPILESMFVAIDNLDRALAAPKANEKDLAEGVRLTRDQLMRGLESAGVRKIDVGSQFDPQFQEAVATVERSDAPPGTVVDTLRDGYVYQSTVVRPAQVRVVAS